MQQPNRENQERCSQAAWKIARLRRPESYPDDPGEIEVIQTHMAWVFLTARHAWKLKKPVKYDY